MACIRVCELAREMGVSSPGLMAWLKKRGEFVHSASALLEPAVERMVRAEFDPEDAPVTPRSPRPSPARPQTGGAPRRGSNPFLAAPGTAWQGTPRPRRTTGTTPRRPVVSDATRANVEAIFGADATMQVLGSGNAHDDVVHETFYRYWQMRLIDRGTCNAFRKVGLGIHEDELAEECLLAGLKPDDLRWMVGDRTILEWIRSGSPVTTIAKTFHDCRANPADAHLIEAPPPL